VSITTQAVTTQAVTMQAVTPVILDGDPGHDDAIAWMLALAHPRLDVRAITTVAGNAPIEQTTLNMLRLATLFGAEDVPLAQGCSRPLVAPPQAAPSVHGASGLDGPTLPEPTVALQECSGVELMARILRTSDRPVWIIATGPLTNVATLLMAYPDVKEQIAGISFMGGGIRSGNWTPAAEFNMLVDPEAASVVFASGIPLLMAGLDVTEKAMIMEEDVERIRQVGGVAGHSAGGGPGGTSITEIVAEWLEFFFGFHRELGYEGAPVHDPVAVVALTHPEILTGQDMVVSIETSGAYTRGATVGDVYHTTGKAPNTRVFLDIEREAYVDLIVEAVEHFSEVTPS
jgi:pyrimidine-specific ribonucleoside hydrolase